MSVSRSRHLVDPELTPLLDLFPTILLSAETLPAMRARELPLPVDPDDAARTELESRMIPGPAGAPDLKVLTYRPKGAEGPLPCIFHIHGGGYVGGRAESMEGPHRHAVAELGCVLVSVNYRLAPETPFPGNIEDCYAALGWVFKTAKALKVDIASLLRDANTRHSDETAVLTADPFLAEIAAYTSQLTELQRSIFLNHVRELAAGHRKTA